MDRTRRFVVFAGLAAAGTAGLAPEAEAVTTIVPTFPIAAAAVLKPHGNGAPLNITAQRLMVLGATKKVVDMETAEEELARLLPGRNNASKRKAIMDEYTRKLAADADAAIAWRQEYVDKGIAAAAHAEPAAFTEKHHASMVKTQLIYALDRLVSDGICSYEDDFAMPAKAFWMTPASRGGAKVSGWKAERVEKIEAYAYQTATNSACDGAQALTEYMGKKLMEQPGFNEEDVYAELKAQGVKVPAKTKNATWLPHWTAMAYVNRVGRDIGMLRTRLGQCHGMRIGQIYTGRTAAAGLFKDDPAVEDNMTNAIDQLVLAQAMPKELLERFFKEWNGHPFGDLQNVHMKTGFNNTSKFCLWAVGEEPCAGGGAGQTEEPIIQVSIVAFGTERKDDRPRVARMGYRTAEPEIKRLTIELGNLPPESEPEPELPPVIPVSYDPLANFIPS